MSKNMLNLKHRFTVDTPHGRYTDSIPYTEGMTEKDVEDAVNARVASYVAHIDESKNAPPVEKTKEDLDAEVAKMLKDKLALEEAIAVTEAKAQAIVEGEK